jgi:hypothetical protein
MAQEKLNLKQILGCIDMGYKGAWDEFTEEERKSVGFWLLNRYVSSVKGGPLKQGSAILKTNEFYNKKFNSIGVGKDKGHPKLMWQLLCLSGNTGNIEFHPYIGFKKRTTDNNVVKVLEQIYPDLKTDEVELLAKLSTRKEIKELAEEYGIETPKL